jgi:acyl-CoA reductase-like NAD-dependent aldehyde dehydrogenase
MASAEDRLKNLTSENSETPLGQIPFIFSASRSAQKEFATLPMPQRMKVLSQLRHLIVEREQEISRVISRATGKPPGEALTTEVMVVADAILQIEKRAPKALGKQRVKTPITFIGKHSYVEYKPRGVVLVISPWNFPFMLAMIPVVEALAAGNSVIMKPSEETPEVGILMESIFKQLGLPEGTVQVTHGGRLLGEALIESKPDFVHFTGSVNTGKAIASATGPLLIPNTLELGGKDPMIVFEDANIERAVNGAIWGAFSNAGQVCMSVERLYVENSIYDHFLDRLVEQTSKLKLGTDDSSDIGPITTSAQFQTIQSQVKAAISEGAKLLTGLDPDKWNPTSRLIPPMILTDVTHQMEIMQEETFGPVLPVMRFDSEEQAIALANDSRFGLNSSVWTKDASKGKRVISKLITGSALLNDVILTIANPYLPYGGVKDSGLGSYHADSGMQNLAIRTAVMTDPGRPLSEINWFPYQGKDELFEELLKSYWGASRNFAKFGISYLKLLSKSKDRH